MAKIFRHMAVLEHGKRGYLYTVTVNGKQMATIFSDLKKARRAAGQRLKIYDGAEIWEAWTEGFAYRVTQKGRPVKIGEGVCAACGYTNRQCEESRTKGFIKCCPDCKHK